MMFKDSFSVPANTQATAPSWRKLQVIKGEIKEWVVYTTVESLNWLQVWIEHKGVQVYPFTRGQKIYYWPKPIPIREKLVLDQPPYELDIYAINTSTSNAHEYHVNVVIEPEEALTPLQVSGELAQRYQELIGGS